MRSFIFSVSKAEKWLKSLNPEHKQEKQMKKLGLYFCNQIKKPNINKNDPIRPNQPLPQPKTLLTMDRRALLTLFQQISLADTSSGFIHQEEKTIWSQIIGGLALSYARTGDLICVATAIRAAACLDLEHPWLSLASEYILSQQQPNGSFGLLESESVFSNIPLTQSLKLQMTVEVLWALAKISLQKRLQKSQEIPK